MGCEFTSGARARTLGGVLDASRGFGAGFDFLRLALAFGVVAVHSSALAHPVDTIWRHRFIWFPYVSILPMFFGLSGFLITASAQRLSLGNFLINRALRIFPALIVEIILSAFILGPIFTSLPVSIYFTSSATWHYFTNLIGWINYTLPGVFTKNPSRWVNGSLWTIPYELGCYAIMSGLMMTGLLRKPRLIFGVSVTLVFMSVTAVALGFSSHPRPQDTGPMDLLLTGQGAALFVYFLLGVAAYLWRNHIPYSHTLAAVCAAWCLVVAAAFGRPPDYPVATLLTCLPLTYLMTYIGLSKIPPLPFFKSGDYSYGVYLYGWPVMQLVRTLLGGLGAHSWILFVCTVAPLTLFAAFSWHAIEKPIIKLRKRFSFVARQRLAGAAPTPALAAAEFDGPSPRNQAPESGG